MHVSGFHVDFSALLQFIVTAAVIAVGLIQLVKATASKYFVVDAKFDGGAGENSRGDRMDSGGTAGFEDLCFVCGRPGSKKCSRCKSVRYCSTTCQSKHWRLDHKNHCKDLKLLDSGNSIVSGSSSRGRRASGWANSFTSTSSSVAACGTYEELKQPRKVLFPYDQFVELFKCKSTGVPPCGLLNCGNSCFANVVLQCLSCTRPLVVYLLEGGHTRGCSRNDWCFLCELQCHIQRVTKSVLPFSPMNILSRLPSIGGNLGCGKQEDAHEFMRFVIDTMQSVCLDEFGGEKSLDLSTQQTTLIQHMFGGHLQSQVICTACGKISYRYENMMDLTVEIQGDAASLEDCLEQFTVKEWLDGENMYKCDRCNDYVKAWKRLTVHQPPNILTIALKRFQSGRFGKLNKRVTFPETLDLGPYMSDARESTDLYALYAVVVHVDMLNASFFGHYICYTKDFCGNWYRVDDCKVMKVELKEVLTQGAYMLLYNRVHVREPCVKPLERAMWEKDQQSREVSLDTVCSPVKLVVSSGISDFVNSGSIRGISDRLTGSSYDSKSTDEFGPESIVEESVEMDLVDPVKVASIGDSTDVYLGLHGLTDDHEERNCHSKALEDVSSVEFMNVQPAIAASRSEPSFFQSNADECMEQTVSSNVEPDFHDEKGAMGKEQGNYLCEDSSDNCLTSKTSEASSSGTLPANSSLSESSNEDGVIPQVSNPVMEQAVLTRNPLISQSGTTRLVRKVSGSSADLNVCAKPKPIFSPGFLGRMRKKNLSNMEKSQTEPMEIYAPLNGNGFVECGFSHQNGSEVNENLKEDERFWKENGWASPNIHKQRGSDVYTHEMGPTILCGQSEDMELDCRNPFQSVHLDENHTVTEFMNELEKNGVGVHFDACRLETNCNGFSAHANADLDGINGSDTCLDYDGPITDPYFLDETLRSKAHKQLGGPTGYSPKLNNPCFTEENGSRDWDDAGVTSFRQNEKDAHLSYKRLKQEAHSTDVDLNHD